MKLYQIKCMGVTILTAFFTAGSVYANRESKFCRRGSIQLASAQVTVVEGATPGILMEFPGLTQARKDIVLAGIRRGFEIFYTMVRNAEFPLKRSNVHGHFDLMAQAAIVTAPFETVEEIAEVTNLMVLVLHLLDDPADLRLAPSLGKLDWTQYSSPQHLLEDVYHQGYATIYAESLERMKRVLPHFDRAEFERATLRMIRGGILLSPIVSRAVRERFQRLNKEEHMARIQNSHPGLYSLLQDRVSNVYYPTAVKSLADAIFALAMGKDMDIALAIYFNIFAGPGVLHENIAEEIQAGEFDPVERLSIREVNETIAYAHNQLRQDIQDRRFSLKNLRIFHQLLKFYGAGFEAILVREGLWAEYSELMFELEMALERYEQPRPAKAATMSPTPPSTASRTNAN